MDHHVSPVKVERLSVIVSTPQVVNTLYLNSLSTSPNTTKNPQSNPQTFHWGKKKKNNPTIGIMCRKTQTARLLKAAMSTPPFSCYRGTCPR